MLKHMPRVRWERAVGLVVVAVAAFYVLSQLQIHLLLRDTTANGGDTGAHVWWPAFMRDHVFSKFRLAGWSPDWYAGFPVGQFYFPIPALLIVALDVFIPYNVAFKLVTALGPVLLPVAAYSLARGLRAPWPAPPLFAVATLPFMFFTPAEHNFRIMGGNLPSTLAGEFSFTIALALAMFFLAALAVSLDTGRRLWLPALLLGLTVMTHGIVTIFAAAGGIVVWVARAGRRTFIISLAVALVAFLVAAVWALPALGLFPYMTDMGWGKVTEYRTYLLHDELRWVVVLAGVALIAGAAFLRRATLELAALVAVFALAFRFMPEGRVWNLRLLSFYQIPLFFMAAMGVAEVVNLIRAGLESPRLARAVAADVSDETGGTGAAPPPESRAEAERRARHRLARAGVIVGHGAAVFALVAMVAYVQRDSIREFIPAWAKWNNAGYEAKDAYPEYREIMDTLGALPVPDGQRLLWERLDRINDYGSDLALELIPHFTDGKIGSMEGLYFESAGTTPYHFLTVAEVANQPSNPVRGLEYGNINDNFDRGVRHLQMLGVRFFMAGSDLAKQKASEHPDLRLVTELGDPEVPPKVARWAIYEVSDAPIVEALAYEPAVLTGVGRAHWRGPATRWFGDESQFERPLAEGGPDSWPRVDADGATAAAFRPLPRVQISDFEMGVDTVRFRVSRPGVPVLVKVSYFPNWHVDGAEGPWRVTPNFMVVVPTENEVELTYGRTGLDRVALAAAILGLVGLVALARWRPASGSSEEDQPEAAAAPVPS